MPLPLISARLPFEEQVHHHVDAVGLLCGGGGRCG
jgi:hypothetical protein